jgi:hypothetical protein
MRLTALAFFLFLSSFCFADQMGTVNASPVPCKGDGLQATACYALDISCPAIPDYTAYAEIFMPARPVGAIIFTIGGTANDVYESYKYGGMVVQNVEAANYEAVELTFGAPFSDGPGWQYDVSGMGVRAASCRYASVVAWVNSQMNGAPVCATGNSGGAGLIGEGLAHYDLGDYLKFAEMTSGPPFSRLDYACLDNIPAEAEYCSGTDIGMGLAVSDAQDFIDPAYPGPWCSSSLEDHSTEHEADFLQDSVDSTDAVLDYPKTTIRFLFGGLDTTSAIRQGLYYQSQIQQQTTYACIKEATHSMPDSLDAAQMISTDLITNCR